MTLKRLLNSLLYSYGQILFSNRRWLGLLLLSVTFFHPPSGLLALAGVTIANLLGWVLRFDAGRIESGFYGFNAVLLGAAYGYYLPLSPFLLALFPLFVMIVFFAGAALENYLATAFNLPGLSLPFVLSLYVTLIFLGNYGIVPMATVRQVVLPVELPEALSHYFRSLALILFQSHWLAGALIALGLLVFSRVLFVLTLLAYAANALVVHLLLPQQDPSFAITAGFNAVLIGIALGGSLIIPSRKSLALALLAVLMGVVFTGVFIRLMQTSGLPVMVLPFNLVVLGTIYSLKFRGPSRDLVLLYFAPGSPEENYYYHHTSSGRFERLRYLSFDLPFSGAWTVSQGPRSATTHRGDWSHAWDFVVCGEDGRTYSGQGLRLEDYHCYRLPVTAPLDGEVALVVDNIPNNPIGDVNLSRNWGNTVILRHAEGLYSSLSHLEAGSLRVTVGQSVKRGEIIGLCGNSGRSPEPHLHFQFQATAKLGERTLDYPFGNYVRSRSGIELVIGGGPSVNDVVQNLTPHRLLKNAFTLTLGDRFEWQTGDKPERWEVKVSIYNTLFIESDAGAWADLSITDRSFQITGFRGDRNSALYCFYLCAAQMPLGFETDLVWRDQLPLSQVRNFVLRPVSELLLLFGPQISAGIRYRFESSDIAGDTIRVESTLSVQGHALFAAVRREQLGHLCIDGEGRIAEFGCEDGERQATFVRRDDEQAGRAETLRKNEKGIAL